MCLSLLIGLSFRNTEIGSQPIVDRVGKTMAKSMPEFKLTPYTSNGDIHAKISSLLSTVQGFIAHKNEEGYQPCLHVTYETLRAANAIKTM